MSGCESLLLRYEVPFLPSLSLDVERLCVLCSIWPPLRTAIGVPCFFLFHGEAVGGGLAWPAISVGRDFPLSLLIFGNALADLLLGNVAVLPLSLFSETMTHAGRRFDRISPIPHRYPPTEAPEALEERLLFGFSSRRLFPPLIQ